MIDFKLVVLGFQIGMVIISFFFQDWLGKIISSTIFVINFLGLLMGFYTLVKSGVL